VGVVERLMKNQDISLLLQSDGRKTQ